MTFKTSPSSADLTALYEISIALANAHHVVHAARVLNDKGMDLFRADAGCTYVRRADDRLEMLAERGCTPRFKKEWHFIPAGCLALVTGGFGDQIFLGSGADFKIDSPSAADLVDQSRRHLIGYAPLSTGTRVLGVFGFSFNREPALRPSPELARAFAGVAALALARYSPNPSSGDGSLSLVPKAP